MDANDKKGFSGLSNLETKVDDVTSIPIQKPEPQPQKVSEPGPARDNRPPISSIPVQKPTPIIDFLKQYWILIGIGIFLIWIFNSNDSVLTESLPPYGSGSTLNAAQIYYCLAENVRIDANRPTSNQYDNYSVQRFNQTISDYNVRCANFKYKHSAMSSAQKALDANRDSIHAQGAARM